MANSRCHSMDTVDDDNRHWTFLLFLALATITLILPLITSPAACHTPAHFVSPHVDFAHAECAYAGQHVQFNARGNSSTDSIKTTQGPLSLMSWAPCIFTIMAFVIKLPHLIWCQLRTWFGINVDAIVSEIQEHRDRQRTDNERMELLKGAVQTLALLLRHGENSVSLLLILARKILTTALSLALFSTVQILADPFSYIGESGQAAQAKGLLRSHSNCTYTINSATGNIYRVYVPCIYPANLMLQKLFIFAAVYSVCLFLLNLFDLFLWATMLLIPEVRDRKLANYIHSTEEVTTTTTTCKKSRHKLDRKFASFLGFDGYLLLMTISQRLGEQAWAEVSILLWRKYQDTVESEAYYDHDHEAEKRTDNPFDQKDSNDFVNEKNISVGDRIDNIELNMLVNSKGLSDAEDLSLMKPTEQI